MKMKEPIEKYLGIIRVQDPMNDRCVVGKVKERVPSLSDYKDGSLQLRG